MGRGSASEFSQELYEVDWKRLNAGTPSSSVFKKPN
jgi:hypothetical protein